MSFGKTAAVTAGFIGAFGLGVWAGPSLVERTAPDAAAAPAPMVDHVANATADEAKPAPRPKAVATNGRYAPPAAGAASFSPMKTSMAPSTPELHARLKPLLNKGANMDVASEGFNSAEQFATVAHAAQNTDVPFMLLKHRVLSEGDTLVAAIRKSKPDVDAVVEVDRARAEARSDIASLN